MLKKLSTVSIGAEYETLAEIDFLNQQNQGRIRICRLIGSNLRFKVGELDRVFTDQETLHFVEIRGRSSGYEDIELVFPKTKRRRWLQSIRLFLQTHEGKEKNLRLWLAVISGSISTARIDWLEYDPSVQNQ